MLHWTGSVIQGLASIVCAILGLADTIPWWIAVILFLAFAVGAVLTAPFLQKPAPAAADIPAQSAFVRGDATGSRISDVRSDAHVFIDGSARESILVRIIHTTRDR